MHRFASLCLTACLVAPLAGLGSCTTNEATGRSHLNFLSREQEIQLGEEAMPELVQGYGGAITDPAITGYMRDIGLTLAEQTEGDYRTLPWEFTLLDSEVINAFALPGGKVFVSRGLAEKFENEAQLAGVLGHEIGHVTAEHADQGMQRQIALAGLAVGIGIAAGSDDAMQMAAGAIVSGAGVFALTFSREQENEADKLGMRYMTAAGYNPEGMLQLMMVLKESSEGAGAPPEWLSTHPLPQTRIKLIQERLQKDKYAEASASGDGFYAERFRAQFLEPIRRLPPPRRGSARLDLSNPSSWCAVCASRGGHAHGPVVGLD